MDKDPGRQKNTSTSGNPVSIVGEYVVVAQRISLLYESHDFTEPRNQLDAYDSIFRQLSAVKITRFDRRRFLEEGHDETVTVINVSETEVHMDLLKL